METNDVVKAMVALAQASRLEIFRALVVAGTEGMTPSALSDALGVAPNTLLVPPEGADQRRPGGARACWPQPDLPRPVLSA